jgi:hypothetical protein
MTAFTEAERVQIRRYAGYEAYGPGASGFQGWRFFQAYGKLEYRLTNITDEEQTQVRSFLTTLAQLEAAIPATGDNLDTDVAAVWTHNKNELRDRMRLYNTWRGELCSFLGMPPGQGITSEGASGIRLVV